MILTQNNPGVFIFESDFGPIPIPIAGHRTMYLVGPTLRGPMTPKLVTSASGYRRVYGKRSSITYLDEAIRAIYEIAQVPVYVQRVAAADAETASKVLKDAGVKQVETGTAAGTATSSANATVTVTANGMTNSPKAITVAIASGDNAAAQGTKIRAALAADVDVSAWMDISGPGANFIGTLKTAAANDGTLNFAIGAGTTGITAVANSANTTAGVAPVDTLQIDAKGPGADYNYGASPKKGVAVTYVNGILKVYDYSESTLPQEVYYDVVFSVNSLDNTAAKMTEINNSSNLINITWLDVTKNPANASADQGLTGGSDGSSLVAADIVGDESADPKTGVYGFASPTFEPGFIMAPGYPQQVVGLALLDVATRFRKLAVIDSTFGLGSNVESLITEKQQYASGHGYAIYCAGWVKALDIDSNAIKDIPRAPFRAAHIAASHNLPGSLANVGAGVEFVYPNVTGLEFAFDDIAHDELNRNGVDIARDFSRKNIGIVSFSGRTVSSNVLYRFNSVRVIFNVIAHSLEQALLQYVFKPIDGQGKLAARIEAAIRQMLHVMWRDDVLFGANPSDAYKVVAQTTNLSLIDQGILGFEVYCKPTPPAERIKVELFRTALSVDLKNNTVIVGDIAVQ